MKKFYSILTLVLALVLASSCEMNQLPEKTEALNRMCPIDMSELSFVKTDNYKVTGVKFDKEKNLVTFEVAVSEKDNEDDAVKILTGMGDKLIHYAFTKLNKYPEFKDFAAEVITANAKVMLHFKSDKNDKEAEMDVPLKEFKAVADGTFDFDLGQVSLEALVEGVNTLLPRDLDDGMSWIGISLGKEKLQMNLGYDERQATIAQFKAVLPQIKKELAKNLNDEGMKLLIDKCIAANRGLVVSFIGTKSGQSADVEYSLEELKAAVK